MAYRVVTFRRGEGIALGDEKGSRAMKSAVRAHANAVENIPVALVLLLMLELNHLTPWLLNVFGIVLLASRVAHAWGLSRANGPSPGRFYGTAITWLCMAAMAAVNLLIVFTR
ncbi:MAG: MAPEG family protein [Oleiphilaceae bacterium]|nr:MAPEG family protein [Oleiphilaceae bacterium]